MAGNLTEPYVKQLRSWIGRQSLGFTLIYRASRDGLSSTSFHQQCDKHGATVTVVYGASHVFGGYTSESWSCGLEFQYKHDKTAFLFRLLKDGAFSPAKYQSKDGQNAICTKDSYGPIFGGGEGVTHDLVVFTDGPIQKAADNTYALNWQQGFGNTYNANGNTFAEFAGSRGNVADIEVYKVAVDFGLEDETALWRKTDKWTPKMWEGLKKEVEAYSPLENLGMEQVQILLIGPIAAGKSSFFNTINSVFRDRITYMAPTGSMEHSVTKQFRKYKVLNGRAGKQLHFRLCDSMGLEEGQGLDEKDIPFILDGNVPDRYQFNPISQVTPETSGFIKVPTIGDRIHCVAFVLDSSQLAVLTEKNLNKLKTFREMITDRAIPQVVLLTKIDKICPLVSEDVSRVFTSAEVCDAVEKASVLLGIPRANVLPVKNYEWETELDTSVDILALLSLRQMIRFSDDYLENLSDHLHLDSSS